MTSLIDRLCLKHLGTLHGIGSLSIGKGDQSLGLVTYEIDGYLDRLRRSANGQIEGRADVLAQAFNAGHAHIALAGGSSVDIVLSDPEGGQTAEVEVSGRCPQFARKPLSPKFRRLTALAIALGGMLHSMALFSAEAKPAAPQTTAIERRTYTAEESTKLGDEARRVAEARQSRWDRKMKAVSGSICTGC